MAAHRRAARSEWSTAQILSAYRGLSHVEAVFRNLKDPGMFATHPQFHWTDQKLHLHAFMCDTAYLLVRLSWRAREAASFSLVEVCGTCCRNFPRFAFAVSWITPDEQVDHAFAANWLGPTAAH